MTDNHATSWATMQVLWRKLLASRLMDVQTADVEERERGRMLNVLLIAGAMFPLAILAALNEVQWFVTRSPENRANIVSSVFAGLAFIGLCWLNHTGRVRWATLGYLLLVIFGSALFFSFDTLNQSLILYAIPIMASSFLLHPSSSFVLASLAAVTYSAALAIYTPTMLGRFATVPSMYVAALVAWIVASRLEHAMNERRRSEEQYQMLVEQIPVFVYNADVNRDNRCLYASPQAESLLGFTPDEWVNHPHLWLDRLHPEDKEHVLTLARAGLTQGVPFRAEYRMLARDGHVVWVRDEAILVQTPGRDPIAKGVMVDITARKQAEEAEIAQRVFAEALCDTAASLNSTLNLDEVLDRILANVARVVPYDAVTISLLGSNQETTHVVRYKSYRDSVGVSHLANLQLDISQTTNLNQIATAKSALAIADVRTFPGWIVLPGDEWICSYAGAPILIKDRLLGFVNLYSTTCNFFGQTHTEHLQVFADQCAIALENARLYAEVHQLALTDELTGLYNRRGLFHLGEREVERALRFHRPLTAILIDIDHFKQVNDAHGHPQGDLVLRAVADCCRRHARTLDLIARYGGEEFVVVLPETPMDEALQVAERLRQQVEDLQVSIESGEAVGVTISAGVATISSDMANLGNLIERADQAQYLAKQRGRNRIETM